MTIGVLVTVKDGEAHIEHALRSVVDQTAPPTTIVVIDDGSTDDTVGVLAAMAATTDNLRFVEAGPVGRGGALNLGLAHLDTEWVAILDADDVWLPEKLELQAGVVAAVQGIDVLGTRYRLIDGTGAPVRATRAEVPRQPRVTDVTSELWRHNPLMHASTLMRRDVVVAAGGYDVDQRRSHFDYDLFVRLAERGHRLHCVEHPAALKRLHPGQSFGAERRVAYALSSASVQIRAVRLLGKGRSTYLVVAARVVWGVAPRRLRLLASRLRRDRH